MDEPTKKNSNDSISQNNNSSNPESSEKTLHIDEHTIDIDFDELLNRIFQYVNIDSILHSIKVDSEYIVQVPSEFQAGLKSGKYFIMENLKTGTKWPTLMEVAENGRHQTVTPLPIVEKEFIHGNPLQDITSSYHNLYIQQQLHELSQMLESTLITVKQIERGQKTDRIGLLESGREQILLALGQKDEDERKQALRLGRQSLSEGRGQLFEAFQQMVMDFKPISKCFTSPFTRYLRECLHAGYFQEKDKEFQEVNDYFNLYLQSTRMLAASYVIVGDMDSAARVFDRSIDRIKQIDFSRIKTISYLHNDTSYEGIYDFAAQFLLTEKQLCLEETTDYDFLSITISGKKLLEVIIDGKTETISEPETK